MYINDVIRLVNRYYPSEYDAEEMYIWCDEVSSMLAIEDRNVFKEAILQADKNGYVLLPEGVDIENIESVSYGGRVLRKTDVRSTIKRKDGLCYMHLKDRIRKGDIIRVVYLKPYYPIRLVKYRGAVTVSENGACFAIPINEFIPGDVISVNIGEQTAEGIPLFETEYTTPSECLLKTAESGISDGVYEDCVITRHVTEQTVCSSPYDSMYIDYVLAKINMYQRDMQAYNHHMTAFNSRLTAYKKWLINHMPQDKGRLINWW